MAGGIYSHSFFVYFFSPKDKRKQFCLRGSPSWYYLWMMSHLFLLLLKTCRSVLTNTACTLHSAVWGKSWPDCLGEISLHCSDRSVSPLGWQPVTHHICEIGGCLVRSTVVIISCPNYLCMGTDGDTSSKKKKKKPFLKLRAIARL